MSKKSKHLLDPSWERILSTFIQEFHGDTFIFADDSKSDTGAGSAFCVYMKNTYIYFWNSRLEHENSVFVAERFDFKQAALWVISLTRKIFIISSDSLSSLFALSNADSVDHMILEIVVLLFNTKELISFIWFRSHFEVAGNELADTLSKKSDQKEDFLLLLIPFPTSYLNSQLKQNSI